MRKLLLSILTLPLLTGCISTAKIFKEMAQDPATVHFSIRTVYGTVELIRTNPLTNSLPHTISPDGTITVGQTRQ